MGPAGPTFLRPSQAVKPDEPARVGRDVAVHEDAALRYFESRDILKGPDIRRYGPRFAFQLQVRCIKGLKLLICHPGRRGEIQERRSEPLRCLEVSAAPRKNPA